MTILKKYESAGNPNKIKDLTTMQKLLEDINEFQKSTVEIKGEN